MSVEFRVKNKKRPLFMGYSDAMSVGKALELLPDLSVFDIDESAEGFERAGVLDFGHAGQERTRNGAKI